MKKCVVERNFTEKMLFNPANAPEGIRTPDLRIRNPNKRYVSVYSKTINNCQIRTYEAGRDAAKSVPSAKRACLVQILVQMAHVISFIICSILHAPVEPLYWRFAQWNKPPANC
jgi:hypothetical protein